MLEGFHFLCEIGYDDDGTGRRIEQVLAVLSILARHRQIQQ